MCVREREKSRVTSHFLSLSIWCVRVREDIGDRNDDDDIDKSK